jgi:hypothetical protein
VPKRLNDRGKDFEKLGPLQRPFGRDPGNKMQRIDAVRIFVAPATNDGSVNRHIDADLRFVSNGQVRLCHHAPAG